VNLNWLPPWHGVHFLNDLVYTDQDVPLYILDIRCVDIGLALKEKKKLTIVSLFKIAG
jgi:hypothetical protein